MGHFRLLFPFGVTYRLISCLLLFYMDFRSHPNFSNLAANYISFSVWNLESVYIQMPSRPFLVAWVQQIVDVSNYADAIRIAYADLIVVSIDASGCIRHFCLIIWNHIYTNWHVNLDVWNSLLKMVMGLIKPSGRWYTIYM